MLPLQVHPSTKAAREELFQLCARLPEDEQHLVHNAIKIAEHAHNGQNRNDGSPYITHPLAVAQILAEWGSDWETIAAGVLHDVLEDSPSSIAAIKTSFGRSVALLVEGVTKFTNADFANEPNLERKTETLRKLFDVMQEDIRVVIVKLADRLHNVRTIETLPPDRRERFAQETMEIYYKLAHHLGMNNLRREFAECCMPLLLPPEELEEIQSQRQSSLQKGASIVQQMRKAVQKIPSAQTLQDLRMHTRSIFAMHREKQQHGSIRQGYVVIAIARDRDGCYDILQLFHSLYRPVSSEFRDYIAAPTESSYQSIRTALIGPEGEYVLLRIRTLEMSEQEQKGILLRCFGNKQEVPGFSWLKRAGKLDLATRESSEAFWEALQSDVFREAINVVVDGKEVHLPQGATVLDALYARHGEQAHYASHAEANKNPARLGRAVQEDDIITSKAGNERTVTFEWLSSVHTRLARTMIVEALKERDRSEKIALGRRLLQKEFDTYKKGLVADLSRAQRSEAFHYFRRRDFEEVMSLIGEGTIRARDVVFFLHPEHKKKSDSAAIASSHQLHLHISGTHERQRDILPLLHGIAYTDNIDIAKTKLKYSVLSHTFDLFVHGKASDRLHFADFLSHLESQEWISKVSTLLSRRQRMSLLAALSGSFLFVVADVLLLPRFQYFLLRLPAALAFTFEALPLLPILATNYYLLSVLRNYVVRMRTDKWFLGLSFFLNISAVILVALGFRVVQGSVHVLPLLLLFTLAMLTFAYKFVQMLFILDPTNQSERITPEKWTSLKREKIIGYSLRFAAVLIWGIEPVLIRYSSLQQLSPLIRVQIWAMAGAASGYCALFLLNFFRRQTRLPYSTEYNRYFWLIVVANISYNYFLHKSLLFTTATNVNLIMSYAPIFALLVAFLIWRNRIAYLRTPQSMQQICLLFGLSAIGGTLLIYNDMQLTKTGALGDVLALIIACSDVVFIMSNLKYIKYSTSCSNTLTVTVTAQHLLWIAVVSLVMILIGNILFDTNISYSSLTTDQWIMNIIVGLIATLGFVLTFEAFKRIDGLLAFLMFNLTPLIAFVPEFLLYGIQATPLFVLGAILIISSSISAEFINSHCEKQGL